ncbi:hypothetical protein [Geobacter sp.]|uniref:hypothetical protein n=1 Tax=Geobacter sp. TaxID=46610 RepID=UPI0027BABCB6|nr:hypothetical protein [Geobacter sp.]
MKVYFFDCDTGVYQGEGFEDEKLVGRVEGITTVAPPPYCKGEIPVYNCDSNVWTVKALLPRTTSDPAPG